MEYLSTSEEETKQIASDLAKSLVPGDVVALYGDLGAGKTTFTRYLTHALGIESRVQSPTFVILRKYGDKKGKGKIKFINHLDLYRIEDINGIEKSFIDELLEERGSVTVIEWPEIIKEWLPFNTHHIRIDSRSENERKFFITM